MRLRPDDATKTITITTDIPPGVNYDDMIMGFDPIDDFMFIGIYLPFAQDFGRDYSLNCHFLEENRREVKNIVVCELGKVWPVRREIVPLLKEYYEDMYSIHGFR